MSIFQNVSFDGTELTHFQSLKTNDVLNIVLSLPVKSCTIDPIPTSLLLQNIDFLIDCISAIVNDSLSSGTMPDCLKHAIISPLLKRNKILITMN